MTDLLVVGDCCADVVVTASDPTPVFGDVESLVDSADLAIGGSSTITACGAARLGLPTALVSRLGADRLGDFLRSSVAEFGVNVDAVVSDPSIATGMSVILVRPGDRAILTALGTIDRVAVADVPPSLVDGSRHVHVGAYYLQKALRPGLRGLFQSARATGTTTSLDPNWDPAQRWDGIAGLLDVLDILFLNETEATALSGTSDPFAALSRLSAYGTTVVIKQGAAGAVATHGGAAIHVPAPRAGVVDSIGAGDSFSAGFLHSRLAGGSLGSALALGCACGALSTRGIGGTAAQPTFSEADAVARTLQARPFTPTGDTA